ncbi:hypothetical protein [Ascidiaceihabitans sp.]|uniref:hypothetical protein n=1 Tax=Ascidiaceihabitans sp. TaxID=1872644 RepID=UPI003298F966
MTNAKKTPYGVVEFLTETAVATHDRNSEALAKLEGQVPSWTDDDAEIVAARALLFVIAELLEHIQDGGRKGEQGNLF